MAKPPVRKSLSQTKHDNANAMNYYATMAGKPLMDVPKVKRRAPKASNPDKPDEPLEHAEQAAVVSWWWSYAKTKQLDHRLLVSVPNAQALIKFATNPHAFIGYLKAEGMRVGMPDLVLFIRRGIFNGLIIEMKRKTKGVVSDDQTQMIEILQQQGYRAGVCRGADQAIRVMTAYMEGK